jgi:hypothetical protein
VGSSPTVQSFKKKKRFLFRCVAEKVTRFRKWSKSWSKNIDSELRNLKKYLMEDYDLLDIKAELEEMSTEEHARPKYIYREMSNLWLREEIKAKERSRDRDIKEGDRNTNYFHTIGNQKRRKMLVHSLDGLDGPCHRGGCNAPNCYRLS